MTKRRAILALGILVATLMVGAGYLVDFIAVDTCLDRGGAFDYRTRTCNTEPSDQKGLRRVPEP